MSQPRYHSLNCDGEKLLLEYEWRPVALTTECPVPCNRSKHAVCVLCDELYLLGGRDANFPLKDMWKFNLTSQSWYQIPSMGESPPSLQEHTMLPYKDSLFVFGGEAGYSCHHDTPLWIFSTERCLWSKFRSPPDVLTPKSRRGHSAVVFRQSMFIFGGYISLKGSVDELWIFDLENGHWHLASQSRSCAPEPRSNHSAVVHDGAMWVFGGVSNLKPRDDLWKWDFERVQWTKFRARAGPGPLLSHSACLVGDFMLVYGGDSNGLHKNELWKFDFGPLEWQKLPMKGLKPSPLAQPAIVVIHSCATTPRTRSLPQVRPALESPFRPLSSPVYLVTRRASLESVSNMPSDVDECYYLDDATSKQKAFNFWSAIREPFSTPAMWLSTDSLLSTCNKACTKAYTNPMFETDVLIDQQLLPGAVQAPLHDEFLKPPPLSGHLGGKEDKVEKVEDTQVLIIGGKAVNTGSFSIRPITMWACSVKLTPVGERHPTTRNRVVPCQTNVQLIVTEAK